MELDNKLPVLQLKVQAFAKATEQFQALLSVDLSSAFLGHLQSEVLIDGLKNGQAQKFELTIELCWKAIQSALYNVDGVLEASPKKVVKAFLLSGHIDETQYLLLMSAIDDRNRLSHLYDIEQFNAIISQFPVYNTLFSELVEILLTL